MSATVALVAVKFGLDVLQGSLTGKAERAALERQAMLAHGNIDKVAAEKRLGVARAFRQRTTRLRLIAGGGNALQAASVLNEEASAQAQSFASIERQADLEQAIVRFNLAEGKAQSANKEFSSYISALGSATSSVLSQPGSANNA